MFQTAGGEGNDESNVPGLSAPQCQHIALASSTFASKLSEPLLPKGCATLLLQVAFGERQRAPLPF